MSWQIYHNLFRSIWFTLNTAVAPPNRQKLKGIAWVLVANLAGHQVPDCPCQLHGGTSNGSCLSSAADIRNGSGLCGAPRGKYQADNNLEMLVALVSCYRIFFIWLTLNSPSFRPQWCRSHQVASLSTLKIWLYSIDGIAVPVVRQGVLYMLCQW